MNRTWSMSTFMFMFMFTFALLLSSCSSTDIDASAIPDLDTTTPAEVRTLLTTSEQPILLNVWASWCIPCRSEAPLLVEAHEQFGDEVAFIGVDVRDNQQEARTFIAEFGLDVFPHLFDPQGAVPAELGGTGVPLTFFYEPGGRLSYLHFGVIDERTLAVHLDELTR